MKCPKYLMLATLLASLSFSSCDLESMGHRTKRILRIERKEYQTY